MQDELRRALRDQLTVSVPLAGRVFDLSRNAAYAAVRKGEIPSIRLGGRIVVPTAQLRRMLGIDENA
jgi:hypothetical protein